MSFPIKKVIFHWYVSLPEGKTYSQQFQQYLCGPPQVLTLHAAVQAPQESKAARREPSIFWGGQVEGEHPPEVQCTFMSIYIYIYIYIIIHIYICICMCIYIYIFVYLFIHLFIYYYMIISYILVLCINMNGHSGHDWLIRF